MAPRDLVDLMLPVCSALIEAHAAGIVHRDLKPQNIFLATGHRGVEPKVLDFGISKSSDSDVSALTGTGSVIGTPHYLAPEQIKDARSASASSDQYSLGVILYKCLTDQNPFEGKNLFGVLHAIVTETPVPLRARRPDLPEGLERVVARAMHPLPWERFASVRALGRALLPYASAKAGAIWEEIFMAGGPEPVPEPEPPRNSRTMLMPTPERAVRFASGVPGAKSERVDSGTLSPAVTSNTSLGLDALTAPRRGRVVLLALVGAGLAAGGFVVFSRGADLAEAPPSVAAPAPIAPVAAPPPIAPVAAAPGAAAEQARLQAKRQAALDQANAREEQARAEAAAKEAAARRDAETKTAAAKEGETPSRRRSSAPARHGSHARREAPAAPRRRNPNDVPVID
jgi:serine/threonine-protein kinase